MAYIVTDFMPLKMPVPGTREPAQIALINENMTLLSGHDHSPGEGLPVSVLRSGLAANRPSFGEAGAFWFATDSGLASLDTGTAWVDFITSAARGQTLIDPIVRDSLRFGPEGAGTITANLLLSGNEALTLGGSPVLTQTLGDARYVQSASPLVQSVNGHTGVVTLTAADVGALSQAAGDGRYVNATGDNVLGDLSIKSKYVAVSQAAGNALVWNSDGFFVDAAVTVPDVVITPDASLSVVEGPESTFAMNVSLSPDAGNILALRTNGLYSAGLEGPSLANDPLAEHQGDLFAALMNDRIDRLPIGTQGQFLAVDTTQPLFLKWVDAPTAPDGGMTQAEADLRYVNITGDAMSGALNLQGLGTAAATLQSRNGADAQPALQITAGGQVQFGPGGAVALDTLLGRTGVSELGLTGVAPDKRALLGFRSAGSTGSFRVGQADSPSAAGWMVSNASIDAAGVWNRDDVAKDAWSLNLGETTLAVYRAAPAANPIGAGWTQRFSIDSQGTSWAVTGLSGAVDAFVASGGPVASMGSVAAQEIGLKLQRPGRSTRWFVGTGAGETESGSNVGTDFHIYRYSDAGAYLAESLRITRSSGVVNAVEGLEAFSIRTLSSLRFNGSAGNWSMGMEGNNWVFRDETGKGIIVFWGDATDRCDFSNDISCASINCGAYVFANGGIIRSSNGTNYVDVGVSSIGNNAGNFTVNGAGSIVLTPAAGADGGYVHPGGNNTAYLGHPGLRWKTVYAATGDFAGDIVCTGTYIKSSGGGIVRAGSDGGQYCDYRYDGIFASWSNWFLVKAGGPIQIQPSGTGIINILNSPDGFYPATATMVVNCGTSANRWAIVYCQNTNTSCSETVKEDIEYLDPADLLEDVLATPVARFRYKMAEHELDGEAEPNRLMLGIIAEKTPERLLYDAGSTSPMSVAAAGIAGVRALHAMIADLQAEVARLKEAIAA